MKTLKKIEQDQPRRIDVLIGKTASGAKLSDQDKSELYGLLQMEEMVRHLDELRQELGFQKGGYKESH